MGIATRVLRRLGFVGSSSAPPVAGPITFADLSEIPDPSALPPLDRPGVDEAALSPEQLQWRREGVAILRGFMPDSVLDPYIERRGRLQTESPEHFLTGWYSGSPYEHVPELRTVALYPPLMKMLKDLIGEDMLMHLNLTGWVSTERNWHQDDYLNPPWVNSWYAAVWFALGEIDPDCGPFEYVPGSHTWPLMRRDKVRGCMSEAAANEVDPVSKNLVWPKTSETFVVPAVEAEIAARGVAPRSFLAQKGDVLVWHGRLLHRGSVPRVPNKLRPALIVHYSGVGHRPDMQNRVPDENGQLYFAAGTPLW
jgi:hypothetical protein